MSLKGSIHNNQQFKNRAPPSNGGLVTYNNKNKNRNLDKHYRKKKMKSLQW